MKHGALKPEYYEDIKKIWEKRQKEDAEKTGIDPEDQGLYALSVTSGWDYLKKHIEGLKNNLDIKLVEAVSSGMNEEEIGKSTVITVLVKECLNSIIKKVEDSALVVEEIQNEQRNAGSES